MLRENVIVSTRTARRGRSTSRRTQWSEVDEDAGTAVARSYFTVLQALPDLPLQPDRQRLLPGPLRASRGRVALRREAGPNRPRRRREPPPAPREHGPLVPSPSALQAEIRQRLLGVPVEDQPRDPPVADLEQARLLRRDLRELQLAAQRATDEPRARGRARRRARGTRRLRSPGSPRIAGTRATPRSCPRCRSTSGDRGRRRSRTRSPGRPSRSARSRCAPRRRRSSARARGSARTSSDEYPARAAAAARCRPHIYPHCDGRQPPRRAPARSCSRASTSPSARRSRTARGRC